MIAVMAQIDELAGEAGMEFGIIDDRLINARLRERLVQMVAHFGEAGLQAERGVPGPPHR